MEVFGLSTEDVKKKVAAGEVNFQRSGTQKTVGDILRENIFTYFNFIFLVLSILVIIAGKFRSLTMTVAVIVNILIGIVQELRAKAVLDKVAVLNQPTAAVIRNGVMSSIPVEKLVLGDFVVFKSGCQIPADARVVSGEVDVNESLLTGESDEIHKTSGEQLFSGSFVVTGECIAELTAVGDNSYIAGLTREAKAMKANEQSEMVRDINKFVVFASIAIIPIGIALFLEGMNAGNGFPDSINSMVAAVVGMIPEGLYVLVSMTLALAAASLAKRKVMLHDMKSIETLARVDVLCVDKTGTVTEPDMQVSDVFLPVHGSKDLEGAVEKKRANELLLMKYLAAQKDENPTMAALRRRFTDKTKATGVKYVVPFSSRLKYSGAVFSEGSFVLGAPDIVLGADYSRYEEALSTYMLQGKRVIVFARADISPEGAISGEVAPLLFIALQNPVRENAVETFRYFAKQGVAIKVISGDNPVTVSEVARAAGIADAGVYVDAAELKNEEDYDNAVEKYTVFGRVKPDQKKLLVQALQKKGHFVAMTGDGVNDIMAMKAADCSIAMASGSDAAVQSSQIVLLDSDFSHMPGIVAEGRRVIGNIERSATLFLMKNMFSMLMAVYSILTFITFPLLPGQMSLVSGFNIGVPAFLLALEPNEKRIEGRFIKKVLVRSAPAALTDFIMIAALTFIGGRMGFAQTDISVAALILLGFIGFMVLFSISRPLDAYRTVVLVVSVAGFVICGVVFRWLFELHAVPMECAVLTAVLCAVAVPVFVLLVKAAKMVEGSFVR